MNLKNQIGLLALAWLGIGLMSCRGGDGSNWLPDSSSGLTSDDGKGVNSDFGNGKTDQSVKPDDDVQVDYPSIEFYATGNLTSRENNAIDVDSNFKIDSDNVVQNITRFNSANGEVNKRVVNLEGNTTYKRVTKEEMAAWKERFKFKPEGFMMYGKSATVKNKNGTRSQSYDMPLPVVVVPGDMARYDVLKNNPIKYENVTVTDDSGKMSYQVNVTVYEEKRTADTINIIVKSEIDKDNNGMQYGNFALPYTANYLIDTKNKKILSVDTLAYYYNDDRKARREITLGNKLCKWTGKDAVETFNKCKK